VKKSQTAMEYIMTYGWVILIIVVIITALFYLGLLNPVVPLKCVFPVGFTCESFKLYTWYTAGTYGDLYLVLGQATGDTITVRAVACTQSPTYPDQVSGCAPCANVTISSGSKAVIAGKPGTNYVRCMNATNERNFDTTPSTLYRGKIYINYTEGRTGLYRVIVGDLVARYEKIP